MNLIYSEAAREDLGEIYERVVRASFSSDVAKEQVSRVRERIRTLKTFPRRYPKYDEARYGELRFFPVENYLVFYRLDEEAGDVIVSRVLCQGRDIRQYPPLAF